MSQQAELDRQQVKALREEWQHNPRWQGIKRSYSAHDVVQLRPSLLIKHSIAELGAHKLWEQMTGPGYTHALGAMSGAQAVNMVRAGLKSIYLSGWQVAADANQSLNTYPDQSLYPSNSVPMLVKRLQNALLRADQIERCESGQAQRDWLVPIVADAEAGFGGPLHAFELMKSMIEAGAAGVHFEDQLASEKKCGHLGGKVLVPTSQFIKVLQAARLASDVCGVASVLIARTDSLGAKLMTSDIDAYDGSFCTGQRTSEGFYFVNDGIAAAIHRSLAYAPHADVLWFETSKPDLEEAEQFARAIHAEHPGKPLAYNCSPSFHWKKYLNDETISRFQKHLGSMGYKFQFITLAGWHLNNFHSFQLANGYREKGMSAYVDLQNAEFSAEAQGYTATRHQREVGTGYFDRILGAISEGGKAATMALDGSTEEQQF